MTEQTAKTVILSSFLTIVLLALSVFAFRAQLISYLESELELQKQVTASTAIIESEQEQIISSIQRVNPAVVSVIVTKDVPVYERYYETFDPWGMFGGIAIPRVRENGTVEQEVGGGSGFIVSNDGLIVTNRHVVEDTEARYSVLLNDGTSYQVEVLARDPQLDIAVLRISEPLDAALTFVKFGDSESLQLGQTVIAIGNALAEFRNSVSVGVVSGLARSIVASDAYGRSEQLDQVIQTDAAINPGNSGGPLLNVQGEVIGVNVATSRGADNIGFALPAHIVKNVVQSVKEHGEIIRPFLGVRYVMLNEKLAEMNGLGVAYGALVVGDTEAGISAVEPGSPAALAGVIEGMVILSIDDVELRGLDLATVLRSKTVGDEVKLKVYTDGVEQIISVTLTQAL